MENLRKIRTIKRISQLQLSLEVGVAQETISAYENGKAMPSVATLIKIADVLDTTTDYLLSRTEISQPVNQLVAGQSVEDRELLNCFRHLNQKKKYQLIAMAIELGREP